MRVTGNSTRDTLVLSLTTIKARAAVEWRFRWRNHPPSCVVLDRTHDYEYISGTRSKVKLVGRRDRALFPSLILGRIIENFRMIVGRGNVIKITNNPL